MSYKKSVVRYREMMSKRYRDGLSLKTQIGVFIRSNKCGSIRSLVFRVREVDVYKVHLFFYLDKVSLFFEKTCLCFFCRESGSLQGLTNFFLCGQCVAIRSNNFQISPKVGGYKVSGGFCVRPYNHPPPCRI